MQQLKLAKQPHDGKRERSNPGGIEQPPLHRHQQCIHQAEPAGSMQFFSVWTRSL